MSDDAENKEPAPDTKSGNVWLKQLGIPEGYAIPSRETVALLGSNNKETADLLKGLFFEDQVRIEITYSSIYDEVWRVTNDVYIPEKLD